MHTRAIPEQWRKGESHYILRGSLELPFSYINKYIMVLNTQKQNMLH